MKTIDGGRRAGEKGGGPWTCASHLGVQSTSWGEDTPEGGCRRVHCSSLHLSAAFAVDTAPWVGTVLKRTCLLAPFRQCRTVFKLKLLLHCGTRGVRLLFATPPPALFILIVKRETSGEFIRTGGGWRNSPHISIHLGRLNCAVA